MDEKELEAAAKHACPSDLNFRKECGDWTCGAMVSWKEGFKAGYAKGRAESQATIEKLRSALEAVRSQMCWERDRDQLTMGFTDLHTAVTAALKDSQDGGKG